MTIRSVYTELWSHPDFEPLSPDAKLLWFYSWSSPHCNAAGLYEITLRRISTDTGIPEDRLPGLFSELRPMKVLYFPELNVLWVQNFVARQHHNPNFLKAVVKTLAQLHCGDLVAGFYEYNASQKGIALPPMPQRVSEGFPNGSRSVGEPSISVLICSDNKGIGVVKGEGELLHFLATLPGWQPSDDDGPWLRSFQAEFPELTMGDLRQSADYHSGSPPAKHKGVWKNRFRNWMSKKYQFDSEKGGSRATRGVRPRPRQERRRPITRIRGDEEPPG